MPIPPLVSPFPLGRRVPGILVLVITLSGLASPSILRADPVDAEIVVPEIAAQRIEFRLPKDPSDPIADFIRFEKFSGPRAQLQTSVTTYRHPQTDQLVSLVGVIHIGDPGYFRRIQQELDAHDLVLYELVGGPAPGSPEDRGQPDSEDGGEMNPMLGMIGIMQSGMTEMLGLSHQMDGINYTRRNLRHADLDLLGFSKGLAERGFFNLDALALLQGMGSSTFDTLSIQAALASRDDQTVNRLRWVMGKTMAQSVGEMGILGVEDIEKPEDLILGLRNDQAWKIFESSLKENWRRTAIFYGAAHMPDLRRRLLEAGWIPENSFWIGAWKIPVPAEDSKSKNESATEARL